MKYKRRINLTSKQKSIKLPEKKGKRNGSDNQE